MIKFIKNIFNKNKKLSYKDKELYYRDRIKKTFIVNTHTEQDMMVIYAENASIVSNLVEIIYKILICSGFYFNYKHCGHSACFNVVLVFMLCSTFYNKPSNKDKLCGKAELLEFLDKNI